MGNYERQLREFRRQKDEAFKYDGGSPIAAEARVDFEGLSYFEPASAWRVRAKVSRLAGDDVFEMATSTGDPRLQRRAARLDFNTPEGPGQLFGYEDASGRHHGPPTLFVPFRDKTSGRETYGAGRYLDIELPEGAEVVVDFNLAYNPFCVYSEAFSCPLPPPENWLEIPVRAGERMFGKGKTV